jgi:hypothetical protein
MIRNLAGSNYGTSFVGKEMSNLYREPSIDASYQVSYYLARRLQRKSCFKIDQFETRIACGSHICKWIGMK